MAVCLTESGLAKNCDFEQAKTRMADILAQQLQGEKQILEQSLKLLGSDGISESIYEEFLRLNKPDSEDKEEY